MGESDPEPIECEACGGEGSLKDSDSEESDCTKCDGWGEISVMVSEAESAALARYHSRWDTSSQDGVRRKWIQRLRAVCRTEFMTTGPPARSDNPYFIDRQTCVDYMKFIAECRNITGALPVLTYLLRGNPLVAGCSCREQCHKTLAMYTEAAEAAKAAGADF